MESNQNSNEIKPKIKGQHSENNSINEGPSTSSNVSNGNMAGAWHDPPRDPRRDHSKKRERSRDREWNRPRNENYREEESSRERLPEEPQQNYPSYPYSNCEQSFDRRTMSMMSSYLAAFNSHWGVGCMDNMAMASPNMAVNATSAMPMPGNMDLNANAGINPYAFIGVHSDPMFMMGMNNYTHYNMMNGENLINPAPVKEIISLTKSVLYPPNPNAPPPTTREKPPGCKTVFVGGLPEKITEEIIREIFERCGEILTIRMSKKNFCHIRFASESYIESAIYLSGYRIKIENKDDPPFTGRIHVDYAQARDDQHEYECQQRALEREARHRKKMEQEYFRPPTPPPVVHYSDHESSALLDKLKDEETFQEAISILTTWLERGECNKRNSSIFYSMIQSTNSHVRRLLNDKLKQEEELNRVKTMVKQHMQGILLQFNEIQKVFNAVKMQKVWDHFSKAQRKHIDLWKKQTEEIKNAHVEEVLNDRIEDEMDLSDEDMDDNAINKFQETINAKRDELIEELNKIREENDNLKCQLEAAQNEVQMIRCETNQEKFNYTCTIKAFKNLASKLLQMKNKFEVNEDSQCKRRRECKMDDHDFENIPAINFNDPSISGNEHQLESILMANISASPNPSPPNISEEEVRLVALISVFLHVHPYGASIDYICSYLNEFDNSVRARDVENIMRCYPPIFKELSTGIGASLEKKWFFVAFKAKAEKN